ncbi:transposase [Allomeiothermus silvanus]|uniref:transposase n=1 Tax=Allomeiothermus silvanus TaxID=52022 RepID=UPI0023F3D77D|nr:transposase [Allomeiothermus silvanus]
MSKMATKGWSTEEKVALVLSVLRGELSMSEASRRHGVSDQTLLAWRDRFLKGGEAALGGKGPDAQVKALENENKQLKEALAEMALRVEVLKKLRHLG